MLNPKFKVGLLSLLFLSLGFGAFCQTGNTYTGVKGQEVIGTGSAHNYTSDVQFVFPAQGEKMLIKRAENTGVTIYSIDISPQPSDAQHIRKMLVSKGQKVWLVIDNQTKQITLDCNPAANGRGFTKHITWQLTK